MVRKERVSCKPGWKGYWTSKIMMACNSLLGIIIISVSYSFFFFFQLLKLLSSDSQAAPYFGFNPISSLPCLRLKYRNTQRTTSPVINFLFSSILIIERSSMTLTADGKRQRQPLIFSCFLLIRK